MHKAVLGISCYSYHRGLPIYRLYFPMHITFIPISLYVCLSHFSEPELLEGSDLVLFIFVFPVAESGILRLRTQIDVCWVKKRTESAVKYDFINI